MATYLVFNLLFMVAVSVCLGIRRHNVTKQVLMTALALIILTTVFDNVIVGLSIVGYDHAKILGIFILKAPVEDFMYALLAAVVVPVIWNRLEK